MVIDQRSPVCTNVQSAAGFFSKIKILEESATAIVLNFLTKVQNTESYNQITASPMKENRDTQISCQIVDSGKPTAGRIREGKREQGKGD